MTVSSGRKGGKRLAHSTHRDAQPQNAILQCVIKWEIITYPILSTRALRRNASKLSATDSLRSDCVDCEELLASTPTLASEVKEAQQPVVPQAHLSENQTPINEEPSPNLVGCPTCVALCWSLLRLRSILRRLCCRRPSQLHLRRQPREGYGKAHRHTS